MMPSLGARYEIKIETISKPKAEYMTDEYFELDLPVAPAVMVGDEILVEGSDISQEELESVICRHLGLPRPVDTNKGLFNRLLQQKKFPKKEPNEL
jgi:hypothetical protein